MGCCQSKCLYLCELYNISDLESFCQICDICNIEIIEIDYDKITVKTDFLELKNVKSYCYEIYTIKDLFVKY